MTTAPPIRRRARGWRALEPLAWLAPVLVLTGAVVFYPMVEMVATSFSEISRAGIDRGWNGLENYRKLFALPDLPHVAAQTALWLVAVVGLTLVVSWPLALLLHQRFPGRALVRYAVIVPWAASLVMTSLIFGWMLNYYYGALNAVLLRLGILQQPVDWLSTPALAWTSLITVGVYVSVPFNTYVLLAGLQSIPEEVLEAARLDGAGAVATWWQVVRPMLSSSVLVAVTLNIVGVFNSFPIIWLITGGGPNRSTHTSITFMYELAFKSRSIGQAAALSVVNLVALGVIVLLYLRWQRRGNEALA